MTRHVKHIAIFASGAGSNAKKIIEYFEHSDKIQVSLVVCNNPHAGVVQVAANANIPVLLIKKTIFHDTGYIDELKKYNIDLIVLAGFLWKVPPVMINAYKNRIINIHPALLPRFGGRGMYGNAVHEAVLSAGEKQSGITIHYVDDIYDHGKTIFQARCEVATDDTAETLANKIHALEHRYYPAEIEKLLTGE
ncbi:MAG TPA: phosphoribosylglycinamide formyltransferase [Chitinophagaceae bacterium]|nr:phosphoribosylglycinamide formyltransferase [Chitinophagaceae bacterium]